MTNQNHQDQDNFYALMKAYSSYEELNQENAFMVAPSSWSIAFTDIRGSTKAIEQGKYKEVNTIGVSAIIAIKNVCDDIPLPFVFGGDGASILFPNKYTKQVHQILEQLETHSRQVFDLELRCAIVPVEQIEKNGHSILVGKIKLSEGNNLAIFVGGGLSFAESLVKGPRSEQYILKANQQSTSPDLTGLECRWNPLRPKNQQFMSLIVAPANESENNRFLFQTITSEINKVVAINYLVKPEVLDLSWPPKHLKIEAMSKHKNIFFRKLFQLSLYALTWIFIKIIKKYKDKVGSSVRQYLNSLVTNTDHYKIDDGIKVILDITEKQKEQLIAILESYREKRLIYFGYHFADSALMTCFVRSMTEHIHFVDGGDGGYAIAAKMLKSQKSSDSVNTNSINL